MRSRFFSGCGNLVTSKPQIFLRLFLLPRKHGRHGNKIEEYFLIGPWRHEPWLESFPSLRSRFFIGFLLPRKHGRHGNKIEEYVLIGSWKHEARLESFPSLRSRYFIGCGNLITLKPQIFLRLFLLPRKHGRHGNKIEKYFLIGPWRHEPWLESFPSLRSRFFSGFLLPRKHGRHGNKIEEYF